MISSLVLHSKSDLKPEPVFQFTIGDNSNKSIVRLADLINRRLSYMKDVAAYKWTNNIPIEDIAREQVVIQKSMEKAATFQLDSASTKRFFEQQIEVAKTVQRYWFERWTKKGFVKSMTFRDLNAEVRPELIELGDKILLVLHELKLWEGSKSMQRKERSRFIHSIKIKGLQSKYKRLLYQSLLRVKGVNTL